ncbi:DMT family transporter [Legionella fallonii]|uniref:Putative drug/metabolite transporter superfamily protein n=1 Tax=Legionella fallonii LLAP-10 TaxID=1212491 RepID=A0A098G803_9GAMM|nr:EamA family transporter [Legionella fallonii]CEG58583.1 putative drug/metabolite transporter superfamily protein [Legionella fallonii LLAP-10]
MQSFKVNCILVGTIVLWASAFVGIRIALADYSPGPLALLRFLVASFFIAVIYHYQEVRKQMPWKDRVQLLIGGMLGIGIYNICLNYGEISVSAGVASFIVGLMPVITILFSFIFFQEKLAGAAWVGILISLLGLFLLAIGEGFHSEMRQGILLVLVSALMGAILTIIQKNFLNKYHPVTTIAWVMWGGTLLLLLYTPDLVKEIKIADYQSTAAVVYMGIFPAALAYVGWSYVLKKLTASTASTTLYSLPIVSTVLGFIVLGEQPSLISLIGGGLALFGALISRHYQTKDDLNMPLDKKVVAV